MARKTTIFTLTSARSGTVYLRHLFQNNIRHCVCRHEPFFDWGNPAMFGRAIYDAYTGRVERVRGRLEKKRRYIERLRGNIYLESSHAFLKSSYVAAMDVFPDLRLVHLIRDPLKVARSQAYRETWRRRLHAPFHYYLGDDARRHFVWALTGNEEIYQHFERSSLTLFQWYLLEWIEIENRAMRFLDQHGLHDRCFTLHSPSDLNNPPRIQAMFGYFGFEMAHPHPVLSGRKNRSLGYSSGLAAEEETQCAAVLERLPDAFLEVFQRPPYTDCHWSEGFQRRIPAVPVLPVGSG